MSMTELELIIDLHLQTDRQGPGSKEDTWTSATRPQKVVHDTETEIAFYMKYKDYYSYGFYIARKAS